ncbi:hypothetical protein BYT27DRAFT_7110348, partial [Phlegmacium glaucopus]
KSNVQASLESVLEVIQNQMEGKVQHTVMVFDKIATEKRIHWDLNTNYFLRVCREHTYQTSMEFINEGDLEELFQHLNSESESEKATVGALGILCKDHCIYPGQPLLVSSDCKWESGKEHANLIQTVLDSVNCLKEKTKLHIVSIASDGETHHGSSFILLTFKQQLLCRTSLLYVLFVVVICYLTNGDDDLTCDKDWKHIFKGFQNLLWQCMSPNSSVIINNIQITPDIIQDHLRSTGLSTNHIKSLFNPDDQQDVKMAFDMLKDIWSLPQISSNTNLGIRAAREVLWILRKFLYHLVFPYLCVDISLSEQIEHLSTSAHLGLGLYKSAEKNFIPTHLFINLMIIIKNVIFWVAKSKVDNPNGEFWLVLLGTD